MDVRLTGRIVGAMRVLMMRVVGVPVGMRDWLVRVRMSVALGEVDQQAYGHEQRTGSNQRSQRIAP